MSSTLPSILIEIKNTGQQVTVHAPGGWIGREVDCVVRIPPREFPTVGRHHAQLLYDPLHGWQLIGLHRNGTAVNGNPATYPIPLQVGDVIELSQGTVCLVVRQTSGPAASGGHSLAGQLSHRSNGLDAAPATAAVSSSGTPTTPPPATAPWGPPYGPPQPATPDGGSAAPASPATGPAASSQGHRPVILAVALAAGVAAGVLLTLLALLWPRADDAVDGATTKQAGSHQGRTNTVLEADWSPPHVDSAIEASRDRLRSMDLPICIVRVKAEGELRFPHTLLWPIGEDQFLVSSAAFRSLQQVTSVEDLPMTLSPASIRQPNSPVGSLLLKDPPAGSDWILAATLQTRRPHRWSLPLCPPDKCPQPGDTVFVVFCPHGGEKMVAGTKLPLIAYPARVGTMVHDGIPPKLVLFLVLESEGQVLRLLKYLEASPGVLDTRQRFVGILSVVPPELAAQAQIPKEIVKHVVPAVFWQSVVY